MFCVVACMVWPLLWFHWLIVIFQFSFYKSTDLECHKRCLWIKCTFVIFITAYVHCWKREAVHRKICTKPHSEQSNVQSRQSSAVQHGYVRLSVKINAQWMLFAQGGERVWWSDSSMAHWLIPSLSKRPLPYVSSTVPLSNRQLCSTWETCRTLL